MGGAWLSLHVYEHYEYTLDREFLDKNYHIMKEAAEFLVEYLTENENGQLVICPSLSPENTYITENGCKGSLCMGSAIDSQITTVLFRAVINSAEILGRDKTFAKKLKSMLKKLPEPVIGRYGQIQEWNMDYNEAEIGHKHVSQLFALCPANLISPEKTPKLADAARATLIRRLIHGKGNEGWSCAWVTDMWASLHDNRMVYENLKKLLARCTGANMITSAPHFSVDGNLGGTSAIADALMQSDGNEINILPALPDVWTDGHIHGLRAKGGFGVDIDWSDGKLSSAVITSDAGGECRVRVNSVVSVTCSGKSVCSIIDNGVIIFNTEAGHKYLLK
jgi:alpha-L-fucosidase 2